MTQVDAGQAVIKTPVTWRITPGVVGAILLLVIALPCFLTIPWSMAEYDNQRMQVDVAYQYMSPELTEPFGTDLLGRSMFWRSLLGGAISLGIGISAACIAVTIGTTWGCIAGYMGGNIDAAMMRFVDILYGLPYILLVVLLDIGLSPAVEHFANWVLKADVASGVADVVTLLLAIGGVSWLTTARVIRGQVLSLRSQPFMEATRALGLSPMRAMVVHLLPNLIGPIVVYATLAVPQAILQESFLSFLGIGVQAPLPSWGNLAAGGVKELQNLAANLTFHWWLLLFPCLLLGLTLMSLNFLGDELRERFDPRSTRRR
ncbi:ABC transporter permease [Mucisphaera calidilacus]|uniref:Dipeptide transport system permease protein DppC n=1 Tax=Mucisphaera calidilacus TaxID=2527982 RepID=A0A518BVN6_9BACT|nr:ABC transporter permease [Mucisphaera calidilacus]QDU71004.1 Dipeptide transport system permease protein DppC [Mucisphaera calidilacus]